MKSILTYLKDLFDYKKDERVEAHLNELAKADNLLQSLIKEKKIPGLAITVLKKGESIFQKGYGYANLESKIEIDPESTIFRIASISKNIAATALAIMVKEEIIDLNTSFYNYVPYFPKKKHDFTIRQLAGHTAGIRGYQGKEYALNKPYSIKDSLEIFKNDDLLFEPGTNYHYNSYDWVLISLAMQEASGIPFEEYVKQKVLNPLGMHNTISEREPLRIVTLGRQGRTDFAMFYSKNNIGFRKAIPVNNFFKLAGGGYLSTSSDIAKFGQAILNKEILDEELLSQFITSEIIDGKRTYYGLGWQVSEDKKGRTFYGHIGNCVGGYSNLFIYPKKEMVFTILVNCTNPEIQDELDLVIDSVLNIS